MRPAHADPADLTDRASSEPQVGTGLPLYARSQAPEEIWVMLLEKAYAKMNGRCYRNLETGERAPRPRPARGASKCAPRGQGR